MPQAERSLWWAVTGGLPEQGPSSFVYGSLGQVAAVAPDRTRPSPGPNAWASTCEERSRPPGTVHPRNEREAHVPPSGGGHWRTHVRLTGRGHTRWLSASAMTARGGCLAARVPGHGAAPRHPLAYRVHFAAIGWADRQAHAGIQPGRLAALLGKDRKSLSDQSTRNAVARAKELDVVSPRVPEGQGCGSPLPSPSRPVTTSRACSQSTSGV